MSKIINEAISEAINEVGEHLKDPAELTNEYSVIFRQVSLILITIGIIYPDFIRPYIPVNISERVNMYQDIYVGVCITLVMVSSNIDVLAILAKVGLITGGFFLVVYTITFIFALWMRLRSRRRWPDRKMVLVSVVLWPVWYFAIYIGYTFDILCFDLVLVLAFILSYIVKQTRNLYRVTGQGVWYCLRLVLTNDPQLLNQFCQDMRLAQLRHQWREHFRQRFAFA